MKQHDLKHLGPPLFSNRNELYCEDMPKPSRYFMFVPEYDWSITALCLYL